MTFDLSEGDHHIKLAPAVLLTKFGSPRALFNVFDPRGPRGPWTPYLCKTFVATPLYMLLTKFGHYYVLRIFHVYKCTVNENTNKSAYWYTSQKSSIPDFAKPGIVAEICSSGFAHSSYLPIDWLTLVWTHPLSQIGNTWVLLQHFCPIMKIGWFPSLVMVEFPVLFGSKVLLAQNHHFGWFPSFFMVHSVVWLQPVFHLKSSGWFPFYGSPVLFGSKSGLCSKSFWVVSLHLL